MGNNYPQYGDGNVGLTNMHELEFILDHVPQGGTLVEVGTYHGIGARWMLEKRPDIRIISVDPFPGRSRDDGSPERWFGNRNPRARQHLFVGTFQDFAALVDPDALDAVFIDGDHQYMFVMEDLKTAQGLDEDRRSGERPRLLILGHDINRGPSDSMEVTRAVNDFCKEGKYRIGHITDHAYVLERIAS